jgi:hypothetical protein
MDNVKYKTVTGTDGNLSVGIGINRSQILKVSRQGMQKDDAGLVSLSSLDGSNFSFLTVGKRISFGTGFPLSGGEIIHIIYKVTT